MYLNKLTPSHVDSSEYSCSFYLVSHCKLDKWNCTNLIMKVIEDPKSLPRELFLGEALVPGVREHRQEVEVSARVPPLVGRKPEHGYQPVPERLVVHPDGRCRPAQGLQGLRPQGLHRRMRRANLLPYVGTSFVLGFSAQEGVQGSLRSRKLPRNHLFSGITCN